MKEFFSVVYADPKWRLVRRFVVVGLSAAVVVLVSKVDLSGPVVFVDSLLALSGDAWLDMVKAFVGAGLLGGLDKLRRELPNMVVAPE